MKNNNNAPIVFSAKKVDFRYEAEIPGIDIITEHSMVIIANSPSEEKIQEVINQFICDKLRDYIREKKIEISGDYKANIKATVTGTSDIKTSVEISRC